MGIACVICYNIHMPRSKEKEPKVVMFGEEVDDRPCNDDHGGSVWGVLFIFLGVLFLLNTLSILPWSVWEMLKRFWPVLLIFVGLDAIFGSNRLGRLVNAFLSFGMLGTILGIVFLRVAPQLLSGLPVEVMNYLRMVSSMIPVSL